MILDHGLRMLSTKFKLQQLMFFQPIGDDVVVNEADGRTPLVLRACVEKTGHKTLNGPKTLTLRIYDQFLLVK